MSIESLNRSADRACHPEAGVFLVGLTASFQAVRRARRFPLLEALRGQ
jgi:hypothetical protein